MKKNLLITIILSVASTVYAEVYVTTAKIIATLKPDESLSYLVPCSLSADESRCAVIFSSKKQNEFRVYTYNNDSTHSPKIAYAFDAGEFLGQSLLGSTSHDSQEKKLETLWSHVGVHASEVRVIVEYKNGKYSHRVIQQNNKKSKKKF